MTSRLSVRIGVYVAVGQTVALGIASVLTGSAALKTQTATNLADVAVGVFLLIGVVTGDRPADDRHPLGHGRERFFWSFVAAVGIFIGGVGAAAVETLQAITHPQPTGSYLVGYAVLAVVIGLDVLALTAGLRSVSAEAGRRRVSVRTLVWRGSDPAISTLVLSSAAGLAGGVVASAGLAVREWTGAEAADATASAAIGLILLATSVVLLRSNRELLTGRGVSATHIDAMRAVVAAQPGVVAVPDLFAILVGPGMLIVDGDVTFDDALDVPAIEALIAQAAAALRARWPTVAYVYLNPVAAHRPRRRGETPSRPLSTDLVATRGLSTHAITGRPA